MAFILVLGDVHLAKGIDFTNDIQRLGLQKKLRRHGFDTLRTTPALADLVPLVIAMFSSNLFLGDVNCCRAPPAQFWPLPTPPT